jgi:glycine/D-amino acid oxidase-like deaminating enzyme
MVATDYLSDSVLSVLPSMSVMCNHGSEYFRLYGGRLLVGGMRHAVRGQQEGLIYDAETSPSVYDNLRAFVAEFLPFISTNFTHSWSGIMCHTKDGLPLVGPIPGKPNQYVMAGFNGYGFSHALTSGMIIRDYIKSGSSKLPGTKIFNPARLSRGE